MLMKLSRRLTGSIGIAVLNIIVGCGQTALAGDAKAHIGSQDANVSSTAAAGGGRCTRVAMHASWAEYYKSIDDLKEHSDFAVSGKIVEVGAPTQPDRGPRYHTVTIQVDKVLWDAKKGANIPSAITFEQLGGEFAGVLHELPDDPMFNKGDEAVLFFVRTSVVAGSKAAAHARAVLPFRRSGGPTGRFAIDANGVVKPVVDSGVIVPAGTTVDGLLGL